MSYHKLNTKPLNASLKTLLKRSGHIGLGISAFTPVLALANPTGGQVVGGQASIATPSANGTVITQTSQSAIINWQQFNIGAGQYVQFLQPSSSSVVLNRVIGGSPSSILGSLTANGQVFLVNTNGVYFGKGASIDTQGFLASTLGITDQNFLAHNYVFDEAGAPGAEIVNDGNITAHHSGYVVLAGDYAENDGVIAAQSGHVILASGSKATLSLSGNSLINFAVSQATLASYAGVKNTGSILADGGTVIMTADVANLLKATVVNNTGLVEAHAISDKGGDIYLTASGGNIENAGTLDVSATRSGQAGGDVTLKGDERTTLTSTSNIDAAGEGANGGSLEISGNTINVRGKANLGKGGNMLLDPGAVSIGTGSSHTGYQSPGATSGIGHIGVKFIQTTLDAGTNLTIAATQTIEHSSKATKITATGTGNLTLNVNHGGHIQLEGLTITIGGVLNASVSPGGTHSHDAAMSFGRITAKSIAIDAGADDLTLTSAGGATKTSLKATGGDIDLTAGVIAASDGSLNLQATGNIDLDGMVQNVGNVNVTAGNTLFAKVVESEKNVSLTASHLSASGEFYVSASTGDITLKGTMGSHGGPMHAYVTLTAGNTIKIDHGIYTATADGLFGGNIDITAKHLVYTGVGNLTLSAGYGNVTLDASIGSAAAPAKYSVRLAADTGYGVYIERSIYTKGSIDATESGFYGPSSNKSFGALKVGNSDGTPITLSATGAITFKTEGAVTIGGDAPVKVSAGANLSILGGNINIGGAAINVTNASSDHSVILHAGNDVDIIASVGSVVLAPGEAIAKVDGTVTKATANNNLTITAGNDIVITGPGNVVLGSGLASADAASDTKAAATAIATANTTLSAGGSINITGETVFLIADAAQVGAVTAVKKQKATAMASADLSITAGGGLDVSGSSKLEILAANSVAGKALIKAGSSSAAAVGVAHADVNLAGLSVTLTGKNLELLGGRDAGGATRSYSTRNAGSTHATVYHHGTISASGKHASAALTATADVTVNAGAGGLFLAGSEASIYGGSGAGAAEHIVTGSHATATEDAESKVALTAGGNLTVSAKELTVRAGASAGGLRVGSYHSPGTSSYTANETELTNGAAGNIKLTADSSLTLKAGGNLSLKALSDDLEISAGGYAGEDLVVQASHGGAVGINLNTALSLTAGKNLQLTAQSDSVDVYAGAYNLAYADITAKAGAKVTAAGSAGVQLIAGANIGINAESEVYVEGGGHGGYEADLTADSAGSVLVSTQANLGLTAKGSISLVAQDYSVIEGGSYVAAEGVHSATQTGSKVTLTGQGGVSFKAGGNLSLTEVGSEMTIEGGAYAAYDNTLTGSSGGATKLTGDAAISINAGGNFLASVADDKDLEIHGGSEAGAVGDLTAKKLGSVTLAADAGVHVSVTGNITLRAGEDLELEGYHYAGYDHTILADSGGKISETALANLSLAAGGNFTAAGYDTSIEAGDYAGYDNLITVDGHGSKFTGTGDGGVAITAGGNVSLTARYYSEIEGGTELAYNTTIDASDGGSAVLTGRDAVSIKAAGNVTASAGSDGLYVYARDYVGDDLHITAVDATGNITGDGGVYITAGGGVKIQSADELVIEAEGKYTGASDVLKSSVTAVKLTADASVTALAGFNVNAKSFSVVAQSDLDLYAGYYGYTGYEDSVTAIGKGAKSAVSADSGVHITTTGAVSLMGNYALHLSAGYGGGEYARAKASHSGSANVSLHEDLTIAAGGGVTIKVAPDSSSSSYGVFIRTVGDYSSNYNYAAYEAQAKAATHGVANLAVDAGVSIVAKGAVNIAAGNNLVVQGGEYVAIGHSTAARAEAQASSGGVANLSAEASIRIQGASIQLTAGDSMSLLAGEYAAGYYAKAYALTGGKATLTGSAGVAFTATGGAFSAAAGKELELEAGDAAGYLGAASASGAKAIANLVANAAATVSARTVSLTASGSLGIYAASAGYEAHALAKSGGKASQTDNAGVNITAATAFTAALTGFASGNDLQIGGGAAGYEADLTASSGTVTADYLSNVNIKVSASGGTLTLKTGSQRSTSIDIYGGNYGAYYSEVIANAKGVVTVGANQGVALSAKGAVNISAARGGVDIYAGSRSNAKGAEVLAKGTGAKATLDLVTSLNITGGNVAIKANGDLYVYGGYEDQAEVALASGSNGGVAGMSINGQTNITAASTLSLTAGEAVYVYGGDYPNASGAKAIAKSKGQASLVTNTDLNLKAGGAMTLTAGGSIGIYGDNDLAKGAKASASDSASATLDATGNVTITAAAFTAGAGGSLNAEAGAGAGSAAKVIAHGTGAVANATYAANVSIATGGAISLKALGGDLYVYGDSKDAYAASVDATSGGAATLNGQARASLTAGGAVTLTAYTYMGLSAGYEAGAQAKVDGVTGKAKLSTDASLSITAGTNLTLRSLTGDSAGVYGGGDGLEKATLLGSGSHGSATATVNQTVSLSAGGNLAFESMADIAWHGGAFPASGSRAGVTAAGGGKASAKVTATVTLKAGGALTTSVTPDKTSAATINANGLVETNTVKDSGHPATLSFSPLSVSSPQGYTSELLDTTTSFGAVQDISGPQPATLSTPNLGIPLSLPGGMQLTGDTTSLGTLQHDALVISLAPVLSLAPADAIPAPTLFTPQPQVLTVGSGDCRAEVIVDDGSRCRIR